MAKTSAATRQTRAVFVRLSEREHRRVAAVAEQHGLRLTDFCRTAIRVAAGVLPVERARDARGPDAAPHR